MEYIQPVLNEPALIIHKTPTKRFLVIADLHLGIEYSMIDRGLQIPSQAQTQRLIDKLSNIIERIKPSVLIILGDIKHNTPAISQMEWQIVPTFFEHFKNLPIHIIVGNHESESQIEGLTTRNTTIHPAQGCLIEITEKCKIALFHGHTWPGKDLFNSDILIMAHNHPVIEFQDKLTRTFEPAWIYTSW